MIILVVEDNDDKFAKIQNAVQSELAWCSLEFKQVRSVSEYCKVIDARKFDLIILDILLPRRPGENPFDVSTDLIQECRDTVNEETPTVALTEMIDPEYETLLCFNEKSVPVLMYSENGQEWQEQLLKLVSGLSDVSKLDFAICCALQKEADAFQDTGCELGEWKAELGALRWRPIEIDGNKGAICVFPQMGMTQSALYTSRIIEFFKPKVVAMSGICAGLKSECNLVDVVVPVSAWDHQVGKITDDGFKQEMNLENVDTDIVAQLKHEQQTKPTSFNLAKVEMGVPKIYSPSIVFGPVASGSVVVASSKEMSRIEQQQRKVIGVEMEIAAFLAACRFSRIKPKAFAAKSVVDFADADKDDDVHDIASSASAQYVVSVMPAICSM